MLERMEEYGDKFYICSLDEKWFYTNSGRNKRKYLPPGEHEDPNEVEENIPTTRSRRFATKVSVDVVQYYI